MKKNSLLACAAAVPYLLWMALLMTLPATAAWYAGRSVLVGVLLLWGFWMLARAGSFQNEVPNQSAVRTWVWGILAGVLVCVLWIAPEFSSLYRRLFVLGSDVVPSGPSPYEPAVCGWPLVWARLAGSAFVIAPAEELFFRFYLYRRLQSRDWRTISPAQFDRSAFLWMVALFALEHNRILAGAMAGAAYGFVSMRAGTRAAIIAHVLTNLLLGLWVIATGDWGFW